jgi:flagellar M-ring protein FliF
MNFLNNAIAQFRELFSSMTPGARVTAGLLLAVVVVSVGYLFRQSTAGPDAFLFGGEALSDGDLNRIELAIAEAGLSGHAREGNRIRVPAGQQAAYLGAIASAGAEPANFNTIFEKALDKSNPWESREVQRERLRDARQRRLSEIVRAMPWVEEAAVIINEEEVRGLNRQKRVTASVSVQPKAGEIIDPRRFDILRKLVAKSISVSPDAVAVTDLTGGPSSSGAIDPAMFENPYYKDKVAFEQYKQEQIQAIVHPLVPGALVRVNVELDDTATEVTRTMTPDKASQVLVRSSETTDNSTRTQSDGGGQPGPSSNGPVPQNVAAAPQRQNQDQQTGSRTEDEYTVGKEDREVTRQGFTPKEILASVAIPRSHFEKLWRQQNLTATDPPTKADLDVIEAGVKTRIENLVEPLIIKSAERLSDTFSRVIVEAVDTLPTPTIEPPSMSEMALAWTGRYWNSVAMLGVAMFSLMMLRSVVKAVPPAPAPAAPTLTLASEEPAAKEPHTPAEAAAAPADDRPRLRLKKGTSIKDDLVEIVKEDPDAAADILRSWIGKAG